MVRADDGEPGGPRADPHRGAGKAARGGARRDRLRRLVHRMVRRGSEARLRRHRSFALGRQAHRRHQAADRSRGADHAVEFPERGDHAHGRPGARLGLPGGDQARRPDALLGARDGRARRARRHPEGRAQHHYGRLEGDRRRAVRQPEGAQALLHRLHRDRARPHAPVRGNHQEALARARRQRALHRLRRRRPRRSGRGRARLEIPQRGPDLRLREPPVCAGRRVRRVRREAHGEGERLQGRRRNRARRGDRAADRRAGAEESRGARGGRGRQRRQDHPGWKEARAWRPLLPTDRADQRDAANARIPRGDLRSGGAADPLQDRGRGHRTRERQRVRPSGLLLQPRRRPHLARGRSDGDRHGWRGRGHHLDGGGAVRRRETVGSGPRRLGIRHRGIPRDQVRPLRRNRQIVRGEEFRDDFRKALPKEVVQSLTHRSPWRATAAIAHDVAVIAVAAATALYFWPNVLIIAISVLVIATRQHALFVIAHDAAHYLLYERRWLNDLAGRACATVQGLSMCTYRVIHRLHHNNLYGELDPDTALHGGYPRGKAYLIRKLAKDLCGLTAWKTYAYFLGGVPALNTHTNVAVRPLDDTSDKLRSEARSDRNAVILFHAVVLMGFAASGYLVEYLVLWILPLATVVQALRRLRAVAEHGATTDFSSPLTAARTNLGPVWLRWLIFPHNVNYHVEHHLYASVPQYNLPRLHAEMKRQGVLEGAQVISFRQTLGKIFADRPKMVTVT